MNTDMKILHKGLQILHPLEMPQGDRGGKDLSESNTDVSTLALAGLSHRGTMLCLAGASREHTLHLAKSFRKSNLTDQKHKRKMKAPIRPLNKLRPSHTHNAYKAKVSFILL